MTGNPKKTRLTTTVLAVLMLSAGALVALPSASAHDCVSGNPANECGECPAGQDHNHRYPNSQHHQGATYCKSSKPPTPPSILGLVCGLLEGHVIEIHGGILDRPGSPIVEIRDPDGLVETVCRPLPNPVPGILGLVCSLVDQNIIEIHENVLDRRPGSPIVETTVEIREPCGRL